MRGTGIAALIVRESPPIDFAGINLTERAIRLVTRIGITRVKVVDDDQPFSDAPDADLLVVLPERVIVEPRLLVELIESSSMVDRAVVSRKGECTNLMALSRWSVNRLRGVHRVHSAVRRLSNLKILRARRAGARFCATVRDARDAARVETEYLRHTSGGDGGGWVARISRKLSVRLTRRLLRLRVSADEITVAGFVCALAAGIAFSIGTQSSRLLGVALSWMSIVLSCSDGEVARTTVTDSQLGAWLETIVGYLSCVVILGGVIWGDACHAGLCFHALAAIVAAPVAFTMVGILGYQRTHSAAVRLHAFDEPHSETPGGSRIERLAALGRAVIKWSFVTHPTLFNALRRQLPALVRERSRRLDAEAAVARNAA
jgi:phosphatidylglycerophosphate synthase